MRIEDRDYRCCQRCPNGTVVGRESVNPFWMAAGLVGFAFSLNPFALLVGAPQKKGGICVSCGAVYDATNFGLLQRKAMTKADFRNGRLILPVGHAPGYGPRTVPLPEPVETPRSATNCRSCDASIPLTATKCESCTVPVTSAATLRTTPARARTATEVAKVYARERSVVAGTLCIVWLIAVGFTIPSISKPSRRSLHRQLSISKCTNIARSGAGTMATRVASESIQSLIGTQTPDNRVSRLPAVACAESRMRVL
jgi:hypothetical protein